VCVCVCVCVCDITCSSALGSRVQVGHKGVQGMAVACCRAENAVDLSGKGHTTGKDKIKHEHGRSTPQMGLNPALMERKCCHI